MPLTQSRRPAVAPTLSPPGPLLRILAWLRPGHLEDPVSCLPIVALLPRRLTDEEAPALAGAFRGSTDTTPSRVETGAEISRLTDDLPTTEDVERVLRYLDECRPCIGSPAEART
ncbi:MAG: DUF3349 domain-containing protein [Tetrasphaera sp.]